jgi:uncharacterized protein DUF1707
MAAGPDPRIADADREAAAHLREHYAQGRLTLEEFNQPPSSDPVWDKKAAGKSADRSIRERGARSPGRQPTLGALRACAVPELTPAPAGPR